MGSTVSVPPAVSRGDQAGTKGAEGVSTAGHSGLWALGAGRRAAEEKKKKRKKGSRIQFTGMYLDLAKRTLMDAQQVV